METERSVRGDRAEIDGRSNCNLAEVCQYGGQAKRDGTQGCSCFEAPDCSKICSSGQGEPKQNGTQECECVNLQIQITKINCYSYSCGYDESSTYCKAKNVIEGVVSGGREPYKITTWIKPADRCHVGQETLTTNGWMNISQTSESSGYQYIPNYTYEAHAKVIDSDGNVATTMKEFKGRCSGNGCGAGYGSCN